jgi:hypothetical protein
MFLKCFGPMSHNTKIEEEGMEKGHKDSSGTGETGVQRGTGSGLGGKILMYAV